MTPDSKHGTGKLYRSCPALFKLERNKESVKLIRASVIERTPQKKVVVCCPKLIRHPRGTRLLPRAPDCGTQAHNKIFRGDEVGIFDYPWLVLLQYQKRTWNILLIFSKTNFNFFPNSG